MKTNVSAEQKYVNTALRHVDSVLGIHQSRKQTVEEKIRKIEAKRRELLRHIQNRPEGLDEGQKDALRRIENLLKEDWTSSFERKYNFHLNDYREPPGRILEDATNHILDARNAHLLILAGDKKGSLRNIAASKRNFANAVRGVIAVKHLLDLSKVTEGHLATLLRHSRTDWKDLDKFNESAGVIFSILGKKWAPITK